MSAEIDNAARFRRRNRQFYWAATLVFAAIVAFMALTLIVVITRGSVMRASTLQQLPLAWAPALFYLWAVWSARQMFAAFSRAGFVFHAVATNALGRIGWALALGAAASLVAAPIMMSFGGRVVGGFATINAPALTLGIVGL